MNINFRSTISYPAIRTEKRDLNAVQILMPLYTGAYGELTSLSNYTYQSLITQRRNKRLSDILDCISMTEMKHFRILGSVIKMLGGDPVFRLELPKRRYQWWNSEFCDFEKNPEVFIQSNIISETEGLRAYRRALSSINDKYIKLIIERIIIDEELHIKIFEELLK